MRTNPQTPCLFGPIPCRRVLPEVHYPVTLSLGGTVLRLSQHCGGNRGVRDRQKGGMSAVPTPRSGGIQSVERAVAVLKLFGEAEPELGVTELARRLQLHKSTISRLMATLEAGGFVQQDPRSGRYRLGLQLATLAGRALNQYELRDVARGALVTLAQATGETCNLAVRDGDAAVNIDQVLSPNPVKHLGWIGRRLPLHCSAAGKPLLAFALHTDIERVLSVPLASYTPRTVTDPSAMWREIQRIRVDGVALAVEEFELELTAAGAPVRDYRGEVIATVSASGPSFRLNSDRLLEVAAHVRATADHLSAGLGYRAPTIPVISVAPFGVPGHASPVLRSGELETTGVNKAPKRPGNPGNDRQTLTGRRAPRDARASRAHVPPAGHIARFEGDLGEERSRW